MKVKIELDIAPFSTPNFVRTKTIRDEGGASIPLTDLDSDVLYSLCEEFKREVFKKAGKSMKADAPLPAGRCPKSGIERV